MYSAFTWREGAAPARTAVAAARGATAAGGTTAAHRRPDGGRWREGVVAPAAVEVLLQTLNVPAFVVDRYRDVLAANRLAQALSPLMTPGVNRLRALFTDPVAQEYHPDWACR
ncbi:hypothetical protein [Actinoallomurus sp. NPDC052274]|uniref:MmyB family transcriptional regulator n=1 Tax=Actinoallomurus sp. NPDC052274 TaxID=3155420 RepID=UPI00344326BE